jgi:HEAT repeat protein
LEGQGSTVSKIESEVLEIRSELLGLRSENKNMIKNFQSVTNVRERLDQFVLKQDEFSSFLNECTKNLALNQDQLADLDDRVENLTDALRNKTLLEGMTNRKQEESNPRESARLKAIKEKLSSKDDGERFEAVYQVLDERVKDALPFLLPLIEDSDQFVQVGAIQTVGEFLFLDAIPVLIKVLRVPVVSVRDEALRQLIRMTGKNDLSFDVRGGDSEREKAIRKWEKWYKEKK